MPQTLAAYHLTKNVCEIAVSFPKDFLSKGRKCAKNINYA